MKFKIFTLFFVLFLLIGSYSFAQSGYDSIKAAEVAEKYQKYQPLRMGINTGIGFGSMRNFNGDRISFFNTFLETRGTYALSPRAGLIMGLGYTRNNFSFPAAGGDLPGSNQFSTDNYFFTGGAYYHLTDRLTVSGVAQYSIPFNNNSGIGSQSLSPMWNTKSFEMNAQYKISENVSIGAGIRYSQGPFGNGFGNTFGNPYGTQFGSPFMRP